MRWDAERLGNRKKNLFLFAIFVVGAVSYVFEARWLQNTLPSWKLDSIGLLIGLLLVALTLLRRPRTFLYSPPPKSGTPRLEQWGSFAFVAIGLVALSISGLSFTNRHFSARTARMAVFEILDKKQVKEARYVPESYDFVVLVNGRYERIQVSRATWNRLSVGDYYEVKVWRGFWGYDFIKRSGD